MLNVLLVDDQPLYRKLLKTIVDWERLNLKIIGAVHNGKQALDIIKEQKVDIVLTDMKMPVMDGLELIRSVRGYNTDIRFVVLSAYDEFPLVRSAYQLGVKEYILKSEISEKQVRHVMQNVLAEIDRLETEKNHKLKMEHYFDENKILVKGKLLKEMIWAGAEAVPALVRKLEGLGVGMRPDRLVLMVITMDEHIRERETEAHSIQERMQAVLEEHRQDIDAAVKHQHGFAAAETFNSAPGEFTFLFSLCETCNGCSVEQRIFSLFERIRKMMQDACQMNVAGGLSTAGSGWESLKGLYRQAAYAGRYHFIKGKGRLYTYDGLSPDKAVTPGFVIQKLDILKELFKEGDYEKVVNGIEKLKIDGEKVHIGDIEGIRDLFDKYHYFLCDYANSNYIFQNMERYLKEYSDRLRYEGDLKQYNEWLANMIRRIGDELFLSTQLVKHARQYIRQHYREGVSLASTAQALGVSSSYLSRVFRKECGLKFTDYLAKVRIEAAIEYMKSGDMKIYEVAENIGYSAPENFIRMFKKNVGKSPRQFFNRQTGL